MLRDTVAYLNFNRGIISPLVSGRVDLKRTAVSAETMTNWTPSVFGSMALRSGLEYIDIASFFDSNVYYIPFIFSTNDTALIELTHEEMWVRVNEALVTRPVVTTTVANGTFNSNLTSWTDNDEAGGTSVWVTGGYMGLTGNGTAAAIRDQTVTVAADSQNLVHAIYMNVIHGPVTLRVGTSTTDDSYINEVSLGAGTHSIEFTPTGNFNIRLQARFKRRILVSACIIDISGELYIPNDISDDDFDDLRFDQSGDVVYITVKDFNIFKIIRRASGSWSLEYTQPEDGPFEIINTGPITISASGISGNITLTSSASLFRATHEDALFKITSTGQIVNQSVTAENVFTNAIRVIGVDSTRVFTIIRADTWVATVTLQRSLTADTGPWEDVTTYTTNATITYDDTLDNVIAWYRIGVKTGGFTSGTIDLTLSIPTGSINGIVRINVFSSATSVSAEVLQDLGSTIATANWYEGSWSGSLGFPSSVKFFEGRLVYAGNNGVWASVSDAYESFDIDTEGDSGPIIKSIGFGPVDRINWLLSLDQLLLGGDGFEYHLKTSSLDEPVTPTNSSMKMFGTQGSANVSAEIIDKKAVFVQRGGMRVMLITKGQDSNYETSDLTLLCPEVISSYVRRIGIQRQPDTRIHCVLNDGTVAICVLDKVEEVNAWFKYTTDGGTIEEVVILPGDLGVREDKVYYLIRRVINGSVFKYLEKFSLESECEGGTLNKQLDCFKLYSGVSTTTITGLSHLEARTVGVWGNGAYLGTYVVSSSQITGLTSAVTSAVVGLPYTAQWKSFKLGRNLGIRKKVDHLGLLMRNVHPTGLQYGHDFNNLYDLPQVEGGTAISSTAVRADYDEDTIPFSGTWDNDSRVCLQAVSPKPCTIIAMSVDLDGNKKS
jgi:hypothetical protein